MAVPDTRPTCQYHNEQARELAPVQANVANLSGRVDTMEQEQKSLSHEGSALCTETKVAAARSLRGTQIWVAVIVLLGTLLTAASNAWVSHQAVASALAAVKQ